MSEYNMSYTGAQLDDAINRVLSGYILPDTTESGTSFTAPKTFGAKTYLPNGATVSIPSGYVQPSGNVSITANGTHNVKNYENAVVNVPFAYEHCQVTPAFSFSNNTTKQTAVYDFGFYVTAAIVIPVDSTAIALSNSTYPLFFAVNGFGYSVGRYGNHAAGISKMSGGNIRRTSGKESEFYWESGNNIHFASGRSYALIAFG